MVLQYTNLCPHSTSESSVSMSREEGSLEDLRLFLNHPSTLWVELWSDFVALIYVPPTMHRVFERPGGSYVAIKTAESPLQAAEILRSIPKSKRGALPSAEDLAVFLRLHSQVAYVYDDAKRLFRFYANPSPPLSTVAPASQKQHYG